MIAWRPALVLLVATIGLIGCTPVQPVPGQTSTGTPGPNTWPVRPPPAGAVPLATPAGDAMETPAPAGTQGIPGELLNAVLADAAVRSGLDPDALVVTRAESVTWNDGSLGCPEPGMYYTQALVNGYWIVVEAGDQALDYRAQGNGYFRLCEGRFGRPRGVPPGPPEDNTK